MIVTSESLDGLFKGFSTAFNKGLEAPDPAWAKIAMLVPSNTASETYAWLGQSPRMREWIGERVIKGLSAYGYTVRNKLHELTESVKRTEIEDDQYGAFSPLFQEMGRSVAVYPDELTFGLLARGFAERCFDGQNFFDTDHPLDPTGGSASVYSNVLTDGPQAPAPWYLMDTSRALKPMVYQERTKPELTKLDRKEDTNVFFSDEYIYGVRLRSNVGFGLPQLAFAATSALTPANFIELRRRMMTQVGDQGRKLGVMPNVLVCGPSNEAAARSVLKEAVTAGTSNVWQGAADLIMTPWLD